MGKRDLLTQHVVPCLVHAKVKRAEFVIPPPVYYESSADLGLILLDRLLWGSRLLFRLCPHLPPMLNGSFLLFAFD